MTDSLCKFSYQNVGAVCSKCCSFVDSRLLQRNRSMRRLVKRRCQRRSKFFARFDLFLTWFITLRFSRHHLRWGDCLEDKRDYENCSVLYCTAEQFSVLFQVLVSDHRSININTQCICVQSHTHSNDKFLQVNCSLLV